MTRSTSDLGTPSDPALAPTEDLSLESAPRKRRRIGFRHLGAAAFLLFLIKGLLWLAVPSLLVLWRWLAD